MKRILVLLAASFLLASPVYAALEAGISWDIRPANGDPTNGGGYNIVTDGGTDHSLQNGAWAAYTDLVIGSAGSEDDLTSAGIPFASDDVDNVIQIASGTGFTTGFYQVLSVAAGVATMDRAVGTADSTAGVGDLGGALTLVNTAEAWYESGNIVHIKNEAWNEAVILSSQNYASNTPLTLRGYSSAHNDNPLGSTRPTNDRAAGAGDAFDNTSQYVVYEYLIAKDAAVYGFDLNTFRTWIHHCKAVGNSNNGFDWALANGYSQYMFCEADNNGGDGFAGGGSSNREGYFACYSHDNSSEGFSGVFPYGVYSIADTNASYGFYSSDGGTYINCTSYGNTGATVGDGFYNQNAPQLGNIYLNNIASTNGDDGFVSASATGGGYFDHNLSEGNTGAARTNFPTGPNAIADETSPGFADAAAGDFSAGTAIKELGGPGAFPGALSTGYPDVGAVFRQEAAGGSNATQAVSVSY